MAWTTVMAVQTLRRCRITFRHWKSEFSNYKEANGWGWEGGRRVREKAFKDNSKTGLCRIACQPGHRWHFGLNTSLLWPLSWVLSGRMFSNVPLCYLGDAIAPHSRCDNQKYFRTLPNVPWEVHPRPAKQDWSRWVVPIRGSRMALWQLSQTWRGLLTFLQNTANRQESRAFSKMLVSALDISLISFWVLCSPTMIRHTAFLFFFF
jgi:hypothetical protein